MPGTYIDLFAGIGGMRIPFDELGYRSVFASEWDPAAANTYEAWHGERPAGDITQIEAAHIPAHDLLLAGFPCQAFSIMGKRAGFADTRGTLFFEIERILAHHRPRAILLENVKQIVTHDNRRTLKVIEDHLTALGYHFEWRVLNALNFGLPQKRERFILVGFTDPEDLERFEWPAHHTDYDLRDILESDDAVDPRLFVSPYIRDKRADAVVGKQVFEPSMWHENKSGNISILDHSCALRTGASYNYLLVNGRRRPSARELLRLQGFPDYLPIVGSLTDVRRQTGNAVPVNLIRAVAKSIDKIITRSVKQDAHSAA